MATDDRNAVIRIILKYGPYLFWCTAPLTYTYRILSRFQKPGSEDEQHFTVYVQICVAALSTYVGVRLYSGLTIYVGFNAGREVLTLAFQEYCNSTFDTDYKFSELPTDPKELSSLLLLATGATLAVMAFYWLF